MNQKTLLFVASLAFAAVTACSSGGGTSDGGTTTTGAGTSSGGSTSASSSGGSSTGAATTGSSSTSGTSGGSSTGSSTGGTTGAVPAPPALGAEIDRMGRPAVNTALTDPLGLPVKNRLSDGGVLDEGAAKDQYNAASDPNTWLAFAPQFAQSLALYDGLDGTCGNQPAANYDAGAQPTSYGTLAGALTDDELYVNTGSTTCQMYLAVEAEVLSLTTSLTDCGGRTPNENVIDETYSLLATGAPAGVTNGITANPNGTANLTTFPYLLPPL